MHMTAPAVLSARYAGISSNTVRQPLYSHRHVISFPEPPSPTAVHGVLLGIGITQFLAGICALVFVECKLGGLFRLFQTAALWSVFTGITGVCLSLCTAKIFYSVFRVRIVFSATYQRWSRASLHFYQAMVAVAVLVNFAAAMQGAAVLRLQPSTQRNATVINPSSTYSFEGGFTTFAASGLLCLVEVLAAYIVYRKRAKPPSPYLETLHACLFERNTVGPRAHRLRLERSPSLRETITTRTRPSRLSGHSATGTTFPVLVDLPPSYSSVSLPVYELDVYTPPSSTFSSRRQSTHSLPPAYSEINMFPRHIYN